MNLLNPFFINLLIFYFDDNYNGIGLIFLIFFYYLLILIIIIYLNKFEFNINTLFDIDGLILKK